VGTGVFYPVPAHKQRHIIDLGFGEDTPLPVSEALSQQVLSLPVHPALTRHELEQIVEAVNAL
jgi:dTDP-4-amino-4,6-dideoxygalactose transaminase